MLINIHRKIVDVFSNHKPATVISFNILILLLLGWIDIVTGDYSLIVFYLIPVSLAAWFVNKSCGILFCILVVIVRTIVEESATSSFFSHSSLHYWNELTEFLFLLIVSILTSSLKKNLGNEKAPES
jgi:hypothetical protein